MSTANLLVLAIGSALYPLLLAFVVLVLRTARPVPLLAGYLLGGAAVSIGLGIAILYVLAVTDAFPGRQSARSPVVDIVLGALALLLALGLFLEWDQALRERWKRRPAPGQARKEKDSWSRRVVERGSFRSAVVVGMALSLPGLYYLAALKQIDERYGTSATAIALILAFNAIQFALVEVPLLLFHVTPERTRSGVVAFNRWLSVSARGIGWCAALVIGVYLVTTGIVALAA